MLYEMINLQWDKFKTILSKVFGAYKYFFPKTIDREGKRYNPKFHFCEEECLQYALHHSKFVVVPFTVNGDTLPPQMCW